MTAEIVTEINRTVRLAIRGGWGHTARFGFIVTTMTMCAGVLLIVR